MSSDDGRRPRHSRRSRRRRRTFPRSSILFFAGLGLIIYEATGRGDAAPRGALIAAYILMMGLPIAEASDLLRNRIIDTWAKDRDDDDLDDLEAGLRRRGEDKP